MLTVRITKTQRHTQTHTVTMIETVISWQWWVDPGLTYWSQGVVCPRGHGRQTPGCSLVYTWYSQTHCSALAWSPAHICRCWQPQLRRSFLSAWKCRCRWHDLTVLLFSIQSTVHVQLSQWALTQSPVNLLASITHDFQLTKRLHMFNSQDRYF